MAIGSRDTHAVCPACGEPTNATPIEIFNGVSLYACAGCDLHFWHPVVMPDAAWHEAVYQGRDQAAMPLEPGHRFFLADPRVPHEGCLLDIGCGVGNFLAEARDAGFDVTGIEFNRSAVLFAQQHYGLQSIFAMRPEHFRAAHPQKKFDIVTFFEVLEHQEDPQQFLDIAKDCLTARGLLALSVPNRDRWQKGFESLDYPPNHLTRWSPRALGNFLERNGFEIVSMRREQLACLRAAQVLSMGSRTGLVSRVAGERPSTLASLSEMNHEQMRDAIKRQTEQPRHRLAARLAQWKNLAMLPMAAVLLPYLRWRGYTGLYLYCLARRKRPAWLRAPETNAIARGVPDVAKPIVTVLIDTYNHERFIEQAIASVLEQDFPTADVEILVVDDGSTDRTPELVRRFEPRVRLLQKKNGGQASAFNHGIPEARGEIVAFLDGDDWWAPNKLSRVVEAMRSDPSLGIVGHGITMVHLDGREQSETLLEGFRFQANTTEGARLFRLRKNFLGTSRMAIRTDLLRRIGPVPDALAIQADEYLFTLAAVLAPGEVLQDALTYYRIHDANGFQLSGNDPQKSRRKLEALAAVAGSLSERIQLLGVEAHTCNAITGIIRAEAGQLRLMLDGGWPWETAKTEWNIYAVMAADAPFSHRAFKFLSLLPALALPPKIFYSVRQRLARNDLYLQARQRTVPMVEPQHVRRNWKVSS